MRGALLDDDVERLAESLALLPEPVAEPALVVVIGLPGTGKTYFCRRLAERVSFVILEADALRKLLFPSPGYRPEESARLFRAVHRLIARLLNRGIPVILDATNLSERNREYLYSIAERLGVPLILVRVEAPPDVVRERLRARVKNPGGNSDADWTVYQKLKSSTERIRRHHYTVDTSRDITPVLNKIVKEVSH